MSPTTRTLLQSTAFLFWVGLLSIGASGFVAGAMDIVWGPDFVAGDLPWVTYTPDRCVELEHGYDASVTCGEAAALDHAEEVIGYRIAAGVLGLLVLLGWLFWRRRDEPRKDALPPGLVSGAATASFLIAGVALTGFSVDYLVAAAGAGQYLSAACVSLVVGGAFAIRLGRELKLWSTGGAIRVGPSNGNLT